VLTGRWEGCRGQSPGEPKEVYESLSAEGKAALASVFSLLVLIPEREAATGKPAPLEEFKLRPGAEEVVKSFAKASLLLSDVDAQGTSVVSLAHEALLSSWPRLQEWLQQNYEFLKVRERVATATHRWTDEHGAEAYLLAEGKPLVEAKELLNRHPETLSGKEMEFIRASIASEQMRRKREAVRRRKVLITISVALVVAIVFGVISFWQYQKATIAALHERKAADQEKIARQNAEESSKAANDARDQADGLITFMLHDLRDKLKPIGRLDILDDVAKKAKEYLDRLPTELVTASRLEQQTGMLDNLGDVRVAQRKLQDALDAYQQGLAIAKRLADQDKSNSGWQRDLIVSLYKIGTLTAKIGGNDSVMQAQEFLQTALNLAELYSGPDRQKLIDGLNLALPNLFHSH
jgi:tetratricopeptide (TPR) repeat protein